MRLYFDQDISAFISTPGTRELLTTLALKRGDTCTLVVQFLRGTVAQELATGATGVFGLKEVGSYDSDFVAAAPSWVKTGTGTATLYTFTLNLATDELNTLLGVGAGADVVSVDLNAELEFVAAGIRTSSPTILATVANDVIRGDEAGPTDITEGTPVNQVTASSELAFDANPSDGETLTITVGSTVETVIFKTAPTLPNHVTIGASASATRDNFAAQYDISTLVVVGAVNGSGVIPLTASVSGTAGQYTLGGTAFGASNDIQEDSVVAGVDATPGRAGTMAVDATHLYVVASVTDGIPLWRKIAHSAL